MITVLKSGRLGNNLFQFAFAYVASKKLNTDFIFDTTLLDKYFELDGYSFPSRAIFRRIKYLFSLKFYRWASLDLNKDISPNEIKIQVRNRNVIYGYFQSPQFFYEYEKDIEKLFKIKPEIEINFSKKYLQKLNNKPSVCIAVRLTDYEGWKIAEIENNTPELSYDYFKKVLSLIPNLDTMNVFVISDDIESVKRHISGINFHYITDEMESFICLQNSKYLIISNSTFHWWGAWLNKNPDKVVYAPKYWLGHKIRKEFPKEIIPSDWIQVEV